MLPWLSFANVYHDSGRKGVGILLYTLYLVCQLKSQFSAAVGVACQGKAACANSIEGLLSFIQ